MTTIANAPSGEKTTPVAADKIPISGSQYIQAGNLVKNLGLGRWTTTGVDMKTAGATTLVAVPAGKVFYPIMVVIRDNTASLAGGTDYDFTGWRQSVDLSGMTTTGTTYRVLYAADDTSYTENAASSNFQITVSTGATAAGTATIDVIGFLA
jgi:hypothetical protein